MCTVVHSVTKELRLGKAPMRASMELSATIDYGCHDAVDNESLSSVSGRSKCSKRQLVCHVAVCPLERITEQKGNVAIHDTSFRIRVQSRCYSLRVVNSFLSEIVVRFTDLNL